ncbi:MULTISPECIES: DUF6985 domain-containing protein [Bacillus cereus group]|uniref:DUF6985 domain-containing protein n=1 Tax=Bacillus mycoides TaxID=1405 RepID=A0A1E8BN98_BACMY|nr:MULTISPECIES: DUF2004 domain-containing protein [Bacillus cereus group]MBJ8072452.1 DUF2004 domain-containing protein [Bacillus cereus]EJV71209.1 hypothetical protein IEM_00769 [Bacillus cereus BAG6O-2]MBJ8189269.1 DUF2004 domain-containing protein [Bacillus cereus]OFD40836.1 hypothetical protein BWGOE2_32010 [Bacillus mycoides]OFD43649.1 hypothetical protein BWGOE1_32430 [Bacillus mycoides]
MTMNDSVFGELEYNYAWAKCMPITFLGNETEIDLMIDGEEDGMFDEGQYVAYQSLMKNWEEVQISLLQSILNYYKQRRCELGYDIGVQENYPLIETTDQILEMISLDGIVVPYADIMGGREIGITFKCTWDIENGVGVRLLNEKVVEVGYQDITF